MSTLAKKPRKLTVGEVVRLINRLGAIQVNILKYNRWRGVDACFRAAEQGLLKKYRKSCAIYEFRSIVPVPQI